MAQKITRTASLPLSEEYVNVAELLDDVSDFDGESRYWRDVKVRPVDGDARIALTNGPEPASDSASVGVAENAQETFASVDFEKAWIKSGDTVESGSEEQTFEIIGTPSSREPGV